MGQPVVHFEVIGKDGESSAATTRTSSAGTSAMRSVRRTTRSCRGIRTRTPTASASVAAWAQRRRDYDGHVTFYVEVPDVEAALAKAESLGGTRMMGPDRIPEVDIEIGLFTDPVGHVVGVVK